MNILHNIDEIQRVFSKTNIFIHESGQLFHFDE